MAKTVRGFTGVTELPQTGNATHRNGGTTVRTFKYPCPNNDASTIIALANQLYFEGYDVSWEEGPVWTLTATFNYDVRTNPSNSQPEPTWEMGGTPIEQHLFDANINIVTGLSTTTKTLIEARLKNPNSYQQLTTAAEVSQLPNATKVYNLMRMGDDSKRIYLPTVKRSITVSTGFSSLTWALNYVGTVVSRNLLISAFAAPTYIQPLMDVSSFQTDTAGIQTFFGYLVEYPNVTYVGNNKVQISQDFIYGKWSTDVYTINN